MLTQEELAEIEERADQSGREQLTPSGGYGGMYFNPLAEDVYALLEHIRDQGYELEKLDKIRQLVMKESSQDAPQEDLQNEVDSSRTSTRS